MLKRIITAIVALIVFVPILVFSEEIKPLFMFAILVINMVSAYEILDCLGFKKDIFVSIVTYLFVLGTNIGIDYYVLENLEINNFMVINLIIIFAYILLILTYSMFSNGKTTFAKASQILIFAFYVTLGLISIVLMRYSQQGKYEYLLIFVGCWMTDIGAYFVGSFLGKHKLIPQVSPKKTVEGAIGGIVGAVLGFVVYGIVMNKFFNMSVNYIQLCILAVVVAIIAQIGDLIASFIKREYGIKDYGKIMPGHGGFLDRFDSIIAVAPVVYFAIVVFGLSLFELCITK